MQLMLTDMRYHQQTGDMHDSEQDGSAVGDKTTSVAPIYQPSVLKVGHDEVLPHPHKKSIPTPATACPRYCHFTTNTIFNFIFLLTINTLLHTHVRKETN